MAVSSARSLASALALIFFAIAETVNAWENPRQLLSMVDAPSLKIHVTFNRPSLQLHEQTEFDVFATPVTSKNGSNMLYDGYATFVNDGKTFTYMYKHGVGYFTTNDGETEDTRCIAPSTLPFNDILPALNEMTRIPSASIGDERVKCTSGNLFKASLIDARFAICAAGRAGFIAFGSDFTVNVEYLDSPVQVVVPAMSDRLSCNVVATATSMTPTAIALLTGNAVPASTSRQLKTAEHMEMEASSCACKSKPRPCVFFHGIGNKNEMEELQDTPKKTSGRMGNMNKHAPCCSEVKYAVLNTMDHSWMSNSLQQKFCDRALRLSETSDKEKGVVRDTVMVTHSMAGLVMSMALATGKCSFGKGASWVALSTPMMGSMGSDYFQDYCDNKKALVPAGLLEFFGQCPLPRSRRAVVYQNGKYASKKLNAAYKKAQKAYAKNVYAAMCSDNPNGIFSPYEGIMIIAAMIIPHKSLRNDGLVEFQSCAIGLDESKFGKSYKDKFYISQLNHADTGLLTYDSPFKDSQKPMKWFECLL